MKSRVWVLVILSLLLVLVGGYIISFRILDINERAEKIIADIVSEKMGVEFTTESLSILPWSIRLNDVAIQPRELPLTVSIRHIRIQFNLLTFMFHNFQPLYSLEQIFLDDPVLEWTLADTEPVPEDFMFERPDGVGIDHLPSTRINIADGAIVLTRGDSTLVCAEEISGWLDGYRTSIVELNIEGKVLSDEVNTTCHGELSKLNRMINIDIISKGCNLAAENIEVVSGDIDPASGELDFNLHGEVVDGVFSLDGDYTITNGSFLLKTLDIGASDIAVTGHLTREEIRFDSVKGTVLGIRPELSGRIRLNPEPMLELTAQAEAVSIVEPIRTLFPDLTKIPSGTIGFSALVAGPLTNLVASAEITADSLIYGDISIDSATAKGRISGDILDVNEFSATVGGWRLSASGGLRDLYHAGDRPFGVTVQMVRESEPTMPHVLTASGTFDVDNRSYDSRVDLTTGFLPLPVTGHVNYHSDALTCSFGDSLVSVSGTITDVFGEAIVEATADLHEVPVMVYADQAGGPIVNGACHITGTVAELAVESGIRIVWSDQFSARMDGLATVTDLLSYTRHMDISGQLLDLRLRYSPVLSWDFHAEADAERVSLLINEPSGAELIVGLDPADGSLTGNLDLDEFPLEWIISLFVREEFSHRGKITGNAVIGGEMSAPWFETPLPLHIDDMTLAGLERLEGETQVSGSRSHLVFENVLIHRDSIPILSADGIWESGEPFLLTAGGNDIELGAIEDVISDSRRTDGSVDYQVNMVFTRENGTVDGTFSAVDGHFYDIPFDHLSGTMSGGSDGFLVDTFAIEREGVYSGTATAESGYFWRDRTETPGLRLHLIVDGDIIQVLPRLTGAIAESHGDCTADLIIGGTWQEPIALDGVLTVHNGLVRPAFLIDRVSDIEAELRIEPDTPTPGGLQAIRVVNGTGTVGDRQLTVNTVHMTDEVWEQVARSGMLTIPNEQINLDFGILGGTITAIKGRDNALKLHIPGFMEDGETGMFELVGHNGGSFYVGASDNGDDLTPYLSGRINILSGDINYPLLDSVEDTEESTDTSFLSELYWDLEINGGPNVNYIKEYNLELGRFAGTTLWQNEIRVEENSSFAVTGRLEDDSFRVTGQARSSNGFITYYGYRFDIDYAELELDTENELRPAILTGRARTIVYDDTLGTENEIFLHVDFVDRESGRVTEARGDLTIRDSDYYDQNRPQTRFDAGALGIIEIRFSSSNPADDTQEKILAKLGVSPGNIGAAATRALTAGIDNFYFNPLLRPFEEKIKQMFRLDMVKISPSILGTFAQESLSNSSDVYLGTDTFFVDRSRVMLGEYFMKDWFISYTAQYGVGRDFLFRKEKGFYHDLGLQYSVERNLRFQGRYIYDDIINQDDARLEFRYDFMFD